MAFVEALFWLSIFLIIYALIGYPLLALLLGAVSGRKVQKQAITPPITLIIAAYNEESAIAEKIESLELDYPRDQLEILVADDGSTDRTREIVRSYADRGVRLYEGEGRAGKTITLNGAVENATGEIVVFSDATGVFNPQSLRELAANFADPTVGCVRGRVAYSYTEDTTSEGFRVYQGFAVAVRNAEGSFGSLTSVSGAIHALRKSIFRPSEASHTQDLADVIHTVAQGYRVTYEYNAVALEESRDQLSDEFESRVRISARENTMVPFILGTLFAAGRYRYLFQFGSHKLLRWWLWAPLFVAFCTNLLLFAAEPIYTLLSLGQLLFYASALLAIALEGSTVRIPLGSTLAFFLVGNAAMLAGAIRFLRKGGVTTWEPIRDDS